MTPYERHHTEEESKSAVWPLYLAAFFLFMGTLQHQEKRILQTAKQQCTEMIDQHQIEHHQEETQWNAKR